MAREVEKEYIEAGLVRLVYVDFVVRGEAAALAAEAAHCAGDQDAFWEYHDLLFDRQSTEEFNVKSLKKFAEELELGAEAFGTCLDEHRYRNFVLAQTRQAQEMGLRGTPTFFINEQVVPGLIDFEQMSAIIEEELAKVREGGGSEGTP